MMNRIFGRDGTSAAPARSPRLAATARTIKINVPVRGMMLLLGANGPASVLLAAPSRSTVGLEPEEETLNRRRGRRRSGGTRGGLLRPQQQDGLVHRKRHREPAVRAAISTSKASCHAYAGRSAR